MHAYPNDVHHACASILWKRLPRRHVILRFEELASSTATRLYDALRPFRIRSIQTARTKSAPIAICSVKASIPKRFPPLAMVAMIGAPRTEPMMVLCAPLRLCAPNRRCCNSGTIQHDCKNYGENRPYPKLRWDTKIISVVESFQATRRKESRCF